MASVEVENWAGRLEHLRAMDGVTLTATKLVPPRIRPDSLPRPRLFKALDEGQVLTLVCTPAGFGKTTLLAQWARQAERPVAWLSLDPDDNDPARFWRHAAAAVARVSEAAAERILPRLVGEGLGPNKATVAALVNELDGLAEEITLVFDDYHLIRTLAIHDAVTYLLDHAPPQLRVVIASRSDPPLPLARLRARAQLTELRAAQLRFTEEESVALLREVWALGLPTAAIAALETRTEGWAAGLQLAALSLQGRTDPEGFLEAFTGSHRYVLDYLSQEVLDRLSEETRDFLLPISVPEQVTGPLCDVLTRRSDGREMLERLERENLFLIALDEERRWFRFHHLFRDLLRARLERSSPELVPELHRRASRWAEEHGLTDDAIRHSLACGDAGRAGELVERHLGETLRRGERATLGRWLNELPPEEVQSRVGLCLARGIMEVHLGRLGEAEQLLDHAERAFDEGSSSGDGEVPTDGGMVRDARAAMALLRSGIASTRGDPEGTADLARSALSQLNEDERGPRLWARWLESSAAWMSGRMEEAESGFAELLAEARAAPDPHPLTISSLSLGWVQQARGKLTAALGTYRAGLRYATEGGRFLPFHAGEAHLGIAQVLYHRDQLDRALDHITKAIELTRQIVFQVPVFVLVTLARIRQAMGDADGARQAADEASQLLPATDVVTMWSPAEAERARLRLGQGSSQEAVRWTDERGLTETDDLCYPRERDYLVLARVFLVGGDSHRALGLLERLDGLAGSQGRTESLIEVRALRSLALQAAGDHDGALRLLVDALELAQPEGYVRVFVDEGAPMAALLRSLLNPRGRGHVAKMPAAVRQHATEVLRGFGPRKGGADETARAMTRLIDPLTARELEVLRLVAVGRRNREIASQLVVTVDTVKKHVSHVFDKLGVASRTEALVRARDLGLIS